MLDSIKAFFEASPMMAWSIASVLVALAFIAMMWEVVRWWFLNTKMSFPFVGSIATLSKDLNHEQNTGWFKSEKTLCREYKKFIRLQDEHDFNEKIVYLTKAGDNGRTPMPKWIWALTGLLVFAEAMGFSYVLAGWTIPGASESMQQTGALGIAFIISVILVAFTHWTGHELYVSSKIKNARREWAEDGRKHKFTTGVIPLARNQAIDDGEPNYTQLANRVGTHEGYKITIATVVIVLIVAAGATYVRGQVLEKSLHQEVVGASHDNNSISLNDDALNMSANDDQLLPEADSAQNKMAKDKEVMDAIDIDRHGGWGTFIILAFIFVFLQILGGIFGFKWGFAGQNSAAAFQAIGRGRYATYSDVREHYNEIADTAQDKLERLQQKLMDRNARIGTDGMNPNKKFRDFMELSRLEEKSDRIDQIEHAETRRAETISINSNSAKKSSPISIAENPAKDFIEIIDKMDDSNKKKAFISNLPNDIQNHIFVEFQRRQTEAANAQTPQLDGKWDSVL